MTRNSMRRRWPIVLAILGLSYLVAVVFYPILGFSFISLDVSRQLLDNPYVQGLTGQNIQHILSSRCIASYYPVRSLTFALDYEIWGLDPTGFKLTGGLIHLANVVLVFWLVVRLFRYHAAPQELVERQQPLDIGEVAVAAFSAGVFAIHPVVIEPVTWAAGREELLMTLGALGCIHFHISARRLIEKGGKSARVAACFLGAAICCAVGCMSNAMGAVIPVLITAWDVLTAPKPKLGRILGGTFALWLIGAATVAVKVLGPSGPGIDMPWPLLARQPGVVLAGYWLNLKTLIWPTGLSLSYECIWPGDLPVVQVVLGAIAAVATCVLAWNVRRQTRMLFGLLWFCLALAPASQLLPHHLQRADRFLYLPLVGLAVATAMALIQIRRFIRGRMAVTVSVVAGLGMLWLLVAVSARQVQKWRDDVTLWEHCVTVAPNDPRAHGYLALAFEKAGQPNKAALSYRKSIQLEPNDLEVLQNFAVFLTDGSLSRLGDHVLAVELAERACQLTEGRDPDLTHTLARAHTTLANTYSAAGRYELAIDHYNKAIEAHPEYDMAPFNLALVLSTCPDESLRDPQKAVELAERGRRLVDSPDAHRLSILAAAYSEAGRFEDAVVVTGQAIDAARAAGDAIALERLNENMRLFKKGMPLPTMAQEINAQAKKLADRLTADFPDNPDAHHVAADVMQTLGSTNDNVEDMRRTLAGNCVNAARIYRVSGDSRETQKLLQTAASLDPANAESRQGLAWLYNQQGRTTEAIRILEELALIEPENPAYYSEIGRLHKSANRPEAAKEAFARAARISSRRASGPSGTGATAPVGKPEVDGGGLGPGKGD